MKISSAGAVEARIWKCRADGQPGFLEPLSFCLLSDSGTGRVWRIYGAQAPRACLKYPWLTHGTVQTALAGCTADVLGQHCQGHASGVLLSTCLLLCVRENHFSHICDAASLVLPECTPEGFVEVVHWGTSPKYYQDSLADFLWTRLRY